MGKHNKNLGTLTLTAVVLSLGLFAGCSFEPYEKTVLSIQLQKQADPRDLQIGPSISSMAQKVFPMTSTLPTDINSFNCVAVNITGSGVMPMNAPNNCNPPPGGWGVVSPIVPIGGTLNMAAPRGLGRVVSVYGVYSSSAPNSTCDMIKDDAAGYLLGSTLVDLAGPTSVSIPVSYTANTTAQVSCRSFTSFIPLISKPEDNKIYDLQSSGNCSVNNSTNPAGTEVGSPNYLAIRGENEGAKLTSACTSGGATTAGMLKFKFYLPDTVTDSLLATSPLMIMLKAASGSGTGSSCTTMSGTVEQGDYGNPYGAGSGAALQIRNQSTNSWDAITATQGGWNSTAIGFGFTMMTLNSTNHLQIDNGRKYFELRFVGNSVSSGVTSCVKIDFMQVALQPGATVTPVTPTPLPGTPTPLPGYPTPTPITSPPTPTPYFPTPTPITSPPTPTPTPITSPPTPTPTSSGLPPPSPTSGVANISLDGAAGKVFKPSGATAGSCATLPATDPTAPLPSGNTYTQLTSEYSLLSVPSDNNVYTSFCQNSATIFPNAMYMKLILPNSPIPITPTNIGSYKLRLITQVASGGGNSTCTDTNFSSSTQSAGFEIVGYTTGYNWSNASFTTSGSASLNAVTLVPTATGAAIAETTLGASNAISDGAGVYYLMVRFKGNLPLSQSYYGCIKMGYLRADLVGPVLGNRRVIPLTTSIGH